MLQTTFRLCSLVAFVTAALLVLTHAVRAEGSPESQRVVWGGPETLAKSVDDLTRSNSVVVTGVVVSTSTHMGEGNASGVVYTSCVFKVDRWIPEERSAGSTITVEFVGGAYRGADGRTRELRLSNRLGGHPEWFMEWPRVGQRLLLFIKPVETSYYVLGERLPRWRLIEDWFSSFELTPAGRVRARGPSQGINIQVLDKDAESFIAEVEVGFKRRAK